MSSTITALTSGGGLAMAGDTSGQLELKTNNGTTAVTIDTSQNVGIGTTTPATKLQVVGDIASSTLKLATNTSVSGSDATIFRPADNTMAFSTAGSERMRITSGGNVLVATSSDIDSSYKMQFLLDGNGILTKPTTNTVYNAATFRNSSSSEVGYIFVTNTATTFGTSSDYRLKENIAPMSGALAKVALLKPVTYKWKIDGSDGQGFIAHELQEVVPDCVVGEKDAVKTIDDLDEDGKVIGTKEVPQYQGIDTSFLVATLTAAIQELNAKVDAQALEIQALKGVA